MKNKHPPPRVAAPAQRQPDRGNERPSTTLNSDNSEKPKPPALRENFTYCNLLGVLKNISFKKVWTRKYDVPVFHFHTSTGNKVKISGVTVPQHLWPTESDIGQYLFLPVKEKTALKIDPKAAATYSNPYEAYEKRTRTSSLLGRGEQRRLLDMAQLTGGNSENSEAKLEARNAIFNAYQKLARKLARGSGIKEGS